MDNSFFLFLLLAVVLVFTDVECSYQSCDPTLADATEIYRNGYYEGMNAAYENANRKFEGGELIHYDSLYLRDSLVFDSLLKAKNQ